MKRKKLYLIVLLILNAGLLYYFKYYTFTLELMNNIFNNKISFPNIIAPLGISFYTFRTISYCLDTYWGITKNDNNLLNYSLYVMFFPQIISGPIVQYHEFIEQLNNREYDLDHLYNGVTKFVIGMAKKMLIADCLSLCVDNIFGMNFESRTIVLSWFGIIAYLIQLYHDFSGYSDMSNGVSCMLGFDVRDNFNYPYISKGAVEYWSRWHISLGDWLKTYIYTPVIRYMTNKEISINSGYLVATFCVWLFAGIWHGTGWHFLAYGMYYFFFVVLEHTIENLLKRRRKKLHLKKKSQTWYQKMILHIYFLFVLIFGQILFRADNLTVFCEYVKNMFGINTLLINNPTKFIISENIIVFVIGLIFCFPVTNACKTLINNKFGKEAANIISLVCICSLMYVCFIFAFGSNSSSFIYFKF